MPRRPPPRRTGSPHSAIPGRTPDHRLTDDLKRYGGHIGYGVRYSEWNKGYGTLMLRLALEKAKNIGITTVLITCDDDNFGSAKVMENNGFALKCTQCQGQNEIQIKQSSKVK